MLGDPEFYAEQAALELSRVTNPEFDLFALYFGAVPIWNPLLVGHLHPYARHALGWASDRVYLSRTFAQKVRFDHDLSLSLFRVVRTVVNLGDIYAQPHRAPHGNSVVFILPLAAGQPQCFFLPCQIDQFGRGIFARTMWIGSTKGQKRKLVSLVTRSGEMIKAA